VSDKTPSLHAQVAIRTWCLGPSLDSLHTREKDVEREFFIDNLPVRGTSLLRNSPPPLGPP